MTDLRTAAAAALEALTIAAATKRADGTHLDSDCRFTMAMTQLRAALAQPEPDNWNEVDALRASNAQLIAQLEANNPLLEEAADEIDALHAKLAQPEQQAKPLFLLHTGSHYDGEQGDWDIEADSGKRVDEFCLAHPSSTIPLFAHPPAQPDTIAVPRELLERISKVLGALSRHGDWRGAYQAAVDALLNK